MSYREDIIRYFGFTDAQFEEYDALVNKGKPIPEDLNQRLVQQGKQIGSSYDVVTEEIAKWVKEKIK